MNSLPPPSFQSAIVLGAGSWGTALAALLHERGLRVHFWGRDPALMEEIRLTRRNSRYLPSLALPEDIIVTSDLHTLTPAEALLFVVPSKGIRETAAAIASTDLPKQARVLVSCAKGIELHTGRRMSEILREELPGVPTAVLTGPNHAEEVAQKLATAAVVSQPSNGGSVAAVAGSVTPVTEPPPVETSAAPSTNRVVLEVPAVAPAPSAVSSGSN